MALASGSRIGPYEILAPLGAGGMGEVYKARDTRLDRTVALKVLPVRLSADPVFRERFDREARVVSSLSHPHICTLFDVGSHGETAYLVMELLEGESLAARLAKGPLPVAQTLRFARQIADALTRAHRQGIVHRDLKPANIMLTPNGAKLLDFGLAKASPVSLVQGFTPGQAGDLTTLESQPIDVTGHVPLTTEGTLLGTIHYMAPEQVEGREADARTDIFAFGATVYEMLTGRKPFDGDNPAAIIVAILERDPPGLRTLQPLVPSALERLVNTCLAKDPEDRWQSARDVTLQLQAIEVGGGDDQPSQVTRARPRWRERVAWAAAAIGVAAAAAMLWVSRDQRSTVPTSSVRFAIAPPEAANLATSITGVPQLALSPDGSTLAFVALERDGRDHLWARTVDEVKPRRLAGTEGAMFPFWSPDSRHLAFFAGGKLKRLALSGGVPESLADAPSGRGGAWNNDDLIVFAPSARDGLFQVSARGGLPTRLTTLNAARGEFSHRWPLFLPDGRRFLFIGRPRELGGEGLYVGSLEGGDPRRIAQIRSNVQMVEANLMLFASERRLMAQRIDLDRMVLEGEPFELESAVGYAASFTYAAFTAARADTLVFSGCCERRVPDMRWFDRSGRAIGNLGKDNLLAHPSLAPDGQRVAVSMRDPTDFEDIWIVDLTRGTRSRFTFDPLNDSLPVWSPDGLSIVFTSSRTSISELFRKSVGGGAPEERLVQARGLTVPEDWSPDGRKLVFSRLHPQSGWDLWIVTIDTGAETVFMNSPFDEIDAKVSPDGQWLAYVSNESGQSEVYVRAFSSASEKWQISPDGGVQPRWRADGAELYFLARNQSLMATEVLKGRTTFQTGLPRPLFKTAAVVDQRVTTVDPLRLGTGYAVTRDGQRFLITTAGPEPPPQPITVVLGPIVQRR